ncbi:MAG: DUF3160 domain-containing protein [Candidatus Coatesbacteria bacterium]
MSMRSGSRGPAFCALVALAALGGAGARAKGGDDRPWVATADVVPAYDTIPGETPAPMTEMPQGEGAPAAGLVFGCVFAGRPAANHRGWIELAHPATGRTLYVPARDVRREDAYTPKPGRCAIAASGAKVRLLPSPAARVVLELVHGEVVPLTGVATRDGRTWYRTSFRSLQQDEIFYGFVEERVGWIEAGPGVELKPDLDEGTVTAVEVPAVTRNVDGRISDPARGRLAQRGLLIRNIPPLTSLGVDDMVDLYADRRVPHFLSSDLFLHAFHVVFDRMLQKIEAEKMLPALKTLTKDSFAESAELYAAAKAPAMRRAAGRNVWYFGVAAALLGVDVEVPPELAGDVRDEVGRIRAASGSGESPQLPKYEDDYSQYRPRGHYTLSEDLKTYFRAMMFFGRKSFALRDDSTTLSALLLARLFRTGDRMAPWRTVVDPITFLVGESDDWGPPQFLDVLGKLGETGPEEELADPARIAAFRRLAGSMLAPHRIVSEKTAPVPVASPEAQAERLAATRSFRLIGQRFTPDAGYFQRLTSPSVGSLGHPKNLPSGLEVMTLLGSDVAERNLPPAWTSEVEGYPAALAALKAEVASQDPAASDRTAYLAWLKTLRALFQPTPSRQHFTRTDAWKYKSLNAGLGSWTELKHDTILYAEQSYAEMGGGGPDSLPPAQYEPPRPKGYVEPNPAFFESLRRLVSLTTEMLTRTGAATAEYDDKFAQLAGLTDRALAIAKKEVEGLEITDDDYEWIAGGGGIGGRLLLPEGSGNHVSTDFVRMALIADVATDAASGRVLLEAVGTPQQARVIVKDYWGGTRVTTGYVYSYYEFTDSKRWTDEEWKARVCPPDPALAKWVPAWYTYFR